MTSAAGKVRVGIVDDHAMVRQALASVLADAEELEVIAQGEDASDAVQLLRNDPPDVLVLDYNMPGGGALRVLDEISRTSCPTRALVLTVHESHHYAIRVLEAGAKGYLVKSSAVDELLDGIRAVRDGQIYITPRLSHDVIDQLRQPNRSRIGVDALSTREFELLRILGAGTSLKEAARELNVSVSTASTYRARLLKKLGLETTSELIRYAIDQGLTD